MLKDGLKKYGWFPLWLSLLLCALVCRPPLPIDETRYLSVAWEMWQGHQFLVPQSNGIPYSHKPPLLFWLIQTGWFVFGVNEWSARLTAPMFGLFSILLARRLALLLWPQQRQLYENIPYLLQGTCFWALYSTLTMFDMLISCFALIAWITLWTSQKQRYCLGWILYGAVTGLGLLSKGPVIMIYTVPPALLAPWWMEKGKVASWFRWYGGMTVAVVAGFLVALAWAVPAARAGGEQYGQAILFGQTAGRIVHSFAHQRPVYWYFLLLPLFFFPWSFYLPIWSGIRKIQATSPVKFCLSIICPGVLLLSIISGKQIHYLLPLLPPSLILLGHGFHLKDSSINFVQWLLPIFLLFFSLALFVVPTLPLKGGDSEMLQFLPRWLGFGPLIVAGLLYRSGAIQSQPIAKTATYLTFLAIFFHFALMPQLNSRYKIADIGQTLHNSQSVNRQIAVYPARLSDQFQFVGRLISPVVPMKTLEETVFWAQQHPDSTVLLFLNKEMYLNLAPNELARPYKNEWLIVSSSKDFLRGYSRWSASQSNLSTQKI